MSPTAHRAAEPDGDDAALADHLEQLVWRRPGLTELALAKSIFGRMGYQQRVNSTCRRLFREGRVERHGTGGPGHPFTYYPGKSAFEAGRLIPGAVEKPPHFLVR
jgi:hypothetical protein